jgi:hypothetical protein
MLSETIGMNIIQAVLEVHQIGINIDFPHSFADFHSPLMFRIADLR